MDSRARRHDHDPAVIDLAIDRFQRLPQAWPIRAHAGRRIELRTVGVTDHALAIRRKESILSVLETRALMRASILVRVDCGTPAQHEDRIFARAGGIKASRVAARQLIDGT